MLSHMTNHSSNHKFSLLRYKASRLRGRDWWTRIVQPGTATAEDGRCRKSSCGRNVIPPPATRLCFLKDSQGRFSRPLWLDPCRSSRGCRTRALALIPPWLSASNKVWLLAIVFFYFLIVGFALCVIQRLVFVSVIVVVVVVVSAFVVVVVLLLLRLSFACLFGFGFGLDLVFCLCFCGGLLSIPIGFWALAPSPCIAIIVQDLELVSRSNTTTNFEYTIPVSWVRTWWFGGISTPHHMTLQLNPDWFEFFRFQSTTSRLVQ